MHILLNCKANRNMNSKKQTFFSFYYKILKNSFSSFIKDDIFTQSAALAYYMVFALPPMLVIIFWLAGLWYEDLPIKDAVFNELGKLMGKEGTRHLMVTLEKITSNKPTIVSAIIGVGSLLFMVSTVFVTVKQELNRIFEVTVKRSIEKKIGMMILDRFLSIAMLSIITLILTISMVVSAIVTSISKAMHQMIGDYSSWFLVFSIVVLNFIILTLLFAITYRYMPDKRLKWRDIWFGSFFTAILFIAGKSLIALIINNSQISNYYEAAGSILVLMLWIYYSSAIFYFGAIITQNRAKLLEKNK